jgi:type II secretory pathway pseudopilin PulG
LIELTVAIAIIAILASVIAPKAFKAIEKAKITRLTADMRSVKAAATSYYSDVGLWPPDVCPNEDPGFIAADNYQNRCCGQNYGPPYMPANYANVIDANWDGPYLEKFPFMTPWGGSYDWEYWPAGGWLQPPGVYMSVRSKYVSSPQGSGCYYTAPSAATDVPNDYEIKLQQQGIDQYKTLGPNTADGTVIVMIMQF